MKDMVKLYGMALKLYPRAFRARFGEEMEAVFGAGLAEAREQGAAARFVLREALRLPASLLAVYAWAMQRGGEGQMALPGGGIVSGGPGQREGWGGSLMGGLPHLLFGLFMVMLALFETVQGVEQNTLGFLWMGAFSLLLVGGVLFNLRKGWRRWSASWLVYLFMVVVTLLNLVVIALTSSDDQIPDGLALIIPLALLYLVYKTTCADRMGGLLAAVPLAGILWTIFQESVPALPRALGYGWLGLVTFAATVIMLRARRFADALWLALAVPALVGLPFAYLGVYLGGTLPFSQPGPNVGEVLRQYLPFLAATMAVVLGPQLAVKLRALGRESAEAGGKRYYRLALGGVLVGLVLALLEWGLTGNGSWQVLVPTIRLAGGGTAVLFYLAGFGLLLRAALVSGALSGDDGAALRTAVLFVLLPGVPLMVFLIIESLMGHFVGWLLTVGQFLWVAAAAWLARK